VPFVSSGQAYAARIDLAGVISQAALAHPITDGAAQDQQLLNAAEFADGYLRQQYKLPLVAWGSDLVQAVCQVAAYRLVCLRGFNPEADGLYKDNYDSAVRWLERVSQGLISPDVTDASPSAAPGKQADSRAPVAYSPAGVTSSGNQTRGTGSR
jgi:phage gp36-like protein